MSPCERTEDGWVSKSGKASLYGLDHLLGVTEPGEIYEYYKNNWSESSAIRRHDHTCEYTDLYKLWPDTDSRLSYDALEDLDASTVKELLRNALKLGYEGIMLRQGETVWRVKSRETYDVEVLGVYEGLTGKNIGKLGGAETVRGRVGGGWTDQERALYWKHPERIIGRTIEVTAQGLTPDGKFRHGNKSRIRWDKEK